MLSTIRPTSIQALGLSPIYVWFVHAWVSWDCLHSWHEDNCQLFHDGSKVYMWTTKKESQCLPHGCFLTFGNIFVWCFCSQKLDVFYIVQSNLISSVGEQCLYLLAILPCFLNPPHPPSFFWRLCHWRRQSGIQSHFHSAWWMVFSLECITDKEFTALETAATKLRLPILRLRKGALKHKKRRH